jgi:MarR family transcriptional regulator, organic hydroperoxide resistance regulator
MTRTSKSTVGYLLRQTNIALSRALQQRLARHNLTSPQMIFMREVWLEEGLSQAELSGRVGSAESTTVSALRVLERRKLIRRVARPGDRRAIRVYLTVTGRKLEQEVIPKIVEVNARVVRGIAPSDLAVFTRVLAAIRDNARTLVEQEHARAGVQPRRRWASEV